MRGLRRRGDGNSGTPLLEGLRGPAVLAVLDASTDAVLGVAPDGTVAFANESAGVTFSGRREDLLGRPADGFVPHLADAVRTLRRRRADGDQRPGPLVAPARLVALRRDGTRFPASVRLTPLAVPDGLLVAVTVHDLTAQQEAEALEHELRAQVRDQRDAVRAVLAAVPDAAVLVTDPDGRVTGANRAAERLLGYRRDELVGRPSLQLSDPEEAAAAARDLRLGPGLDPLLEVARSGLPNEQDWTFVTSEGHRRPVTVRVTPAGDRRNPSGFVCVATERALAWDPVLTARTGTESLLLDLDDAPTRTLRWQVGSGGPRRR